MTRLAFAPLSLLAACQNQPAANDAAAAAPARVEAARPLSDVARAEQVVRRQLGNPPGIAFANAVRHETDGVAIVCGDVERGGRRERYIVVDGARAWIESQMRAGEMARAVREFCGDGERG